MDVLLPAGLTEIYTQIYCFPSTPRSVTPCIRLVHGLKTFHLELGGMWVTSMMFWHCLNIQKNYLNFQVSLCSSCITHKKQSMTLSSGPDCLRNHLPLLKCQLPFNAFAIMPQTSFCRTLRVKVLKKLAVPSRTQFTRCCTSYNTKFMTQPH